MVYRSDYFKAYGQRVGNRRPEQALACTAHRLSYRSRDAFKSNPWESSACSDRSDLTSSLCLIARSYEGSDELFFLTQTQRSAAKLDNASAADTLSVDLTGTTYALNLARATNTLNLTGTADALNLAGAPNTFDLASAANTGGYRHR